MATSNAEPPLVTVTNPVTYLRRWWSKVMGKEGIDLSFKIHPITAVLMVAVTATIGFGAGRISVPDGIKIPFFEFGDVPSAKPTPSAEAVWKETAFTGKLQYSKTENRYFLVTTSSEAITLNILGNLDLSSLVDKRIFVVGDYSKSLRILEVTDAKDLEILSKTPIPIPTFEVTPTPSLIPTPVPSEPSTSATPIVTDTIETE
ncbi:MAG TPA: hypothetical protein VI795_00300 [Patescibacteria group bacterium]|nr:hypothetical protein [Patescibacteria group bacterium]